MVLWYLWWNRSLFFVDPYTTWSYLCWLYMIMMYPHHLLLFRLVNTITDLAWVFSLLWKLWSQIGQVHIYHGIININHSYSITLLTTNYLVIIKHTKVAIIIIGWQRFLRCCVAVKLCHLLSWWSGCDVIEVLDDLYITVTSGPIVESGEISAT